MEPTERTSEPNTNFLRHLDVEYRVGHKLRRASSRQPAGDTFIDQCAGHVMDLPHEETVQGIDIVARVNPPRQEPPGELG